MVVLLHTQILHSSCEENPDKPGNIRDEASINELLVLANLERYNAILIEQDKTQGERMNLLRELAVSQLKSLKGLETSERLVVLQ